MEWFGSEALKLPVGFAKGGLLEKRSFQKSPQISRDVRESRERPDCGKQRTIRLGPETLDSLEILQIPGKILQ